MKERTGKLLKYSASAAIAVLLLWVSFKEVEWKDFFSLLKECRWGLVLLSMLAGYLAIIVRSVRWRMLLHPMDANLTSLQCYDGVNVGRLSDLLVPHMGEFVRCAVVSRRHLTYDKVLGTVLVERSWDILSLIALVVAFLLTASSRFTTFFTEDILTPVSGKLSFSIWWLLALVAVLIALLFLFIYKTRERFGICGKVCGFFGGLWEGIKTCLKMKRKGVFFLYTILLWMLFLMTSYLVIISLPQSAGMGLSDALFLMLVGSFAAIVPVPGGFGAFHYVISLALSTIYGVPWAAGIVFATLSHESQAIMSIVAGLASYAHVASGK